ncbi:TPA: tail fiber assembly protein [Citrobacter freundii]
MKYFYSADTNAFYAEVLKSEYKLAGSWPQDARPISDKTYLTFVTSPPEGKMLGSDEKGSPCWVNTQQVVDYQAIATIERDKLMAVATTRITWLQGAQEDGDISADEEKELAILRAYRTELRRLDLTGAPDIDWPEVPGDVA